MAQDPLVSGQPPEQQAPLPQVPLFQRLRPVPFAVVSLAVIFFLYQFVGGGITLAIFWLTGAIGGPQGALRLTFSDENVLVTRLATMGGQLLFILVPTILLVKLRKERVLSYLRIAVPDYRVILLTVVAVFALQQVLEGYLALQDAIPLPSPLHDLMDRFKDTFEETYRLLITAHSPGEFVVVVLVVALTPAICEELFFRGLVQRSFEMVTVGAQGAIITGVIFGAFHLALYSFVPLAVLGAYFGFIVYRSQNVTVAVSAHFFNNFVACTAAYLQLNDDFVAIAPQHTPTGSLIFLNTAAFGVVFLAATYYFVHITQSAAQE